MSNWKVRAEPRKWQKLALKEWFSGLKGVVSVTTGAGKTIFALLAMEKLKNTHKINKNTHTISFFFVEHMHLGPS